MGQMANKALLGTNLRFASVCPRARRWVMGILSALAVLACLLSLSSELGNAGQLAIIILMLTFYAYAAFYLLNPSLLKSHFKN